MTLRKVTRFGVVALILSGLAACGGNGPGPTPGPTPGTNGISGTVSSPGDVAGTLIAACFSESCDPATDGNSSGTQITTSVSSAPYSVAVNPAQYVLIAIQDANGNGGLDAGDYIGGYPSVEASAPVTAPASGVAITLVPYTPASSGSAPAWLESARARLLNAE